jgi:RimJ/RimL family protein N-acetyltransferase
MEDTAAWTRLPTIDAPRVRLRWLDENDAAGLFEIFSNREVTRYWGWPALEDIAAATELVRSIHGMFEQRSLFQWGVVRRDLDQVIGTSTLAHVDPRNGRAELGFALHRGHWGQGFAGEAVTALIQFAFGPLGLRRLEADVDPRNDRSLALLQRLGFVREGYLRERWNVNGEIQDAVFCGLLAREWASRLPSASPDDPQGIVVRKRLS